MFSSCLANQHYNTKTIPQLRGFFDSWSAHMLAIESYNTAAPTTNSLRHNSLVYATSLSTLLTQTRPRHPSPLVSPSLPTHPNTRKRPSLSNPNLQAHTPTYPPEKARPHRHAPKTKSPSH